MPTPLDVARKRLIFLFGCWLACCMAAAPALGKDQPAEEKEPELVGFELGAFVLKDYQPLGDVTTRLIFRAHASVKEDQSELFAKRLENRRHRVREQILIAARLAEPEELQDPSLEKLRRRILLRIRHSLPELPIDEVYLSEFQYFTKN